MQLEIEWDGQEYGYDPEEIDMPTATTIKDHTGWGLKTWSKEVDEMNPIALNALLYAIKRQNGDKTVLINTCRVDKPVKFYNVLAAATSAAMGKDLAQKVGKRQEKAANPPTRTPTSKKSGSKTFSGSPSGAI